MFVVYNYLMVLVSFLLKLVALVNPKMKLFVEGRKNVFSTIGQLQKKDKTIWFHAASLGEFEQGRPIIEKLKLTFPLYCNEI